jgi:DNA-directed RNA polymerase subunit RPC12/RpoP
MIICVDCKKEMKCMKNGVKVRYGADHCYSGDLYECQSCGKEVINTNDNPYSSKTPLNDFDIQMP